MVVHYALTCGKHPFGVNAEQIAANLRSRTYQVEALPSECDSLVHALITCNPELRPTAQQTLK